MYCTRCGRKLEEGEVCTCTQDQKNKKVQEKAPTQPSNENQNAVGTAPEQPSKQAEWLQESGTQALKCIKEFLGKVLQILKKPVSETERLAAENTKTTGMQFILVKAAIVLILVLVTAAGIRKEFVENPNVFDPRKYLGPARDLIKETVEHKMKDVFGSSNRI